MTYGHQGHRFAHFSTGYLGLLCPGGNSEPCAPIAGTKIECWGMYKWVPGSFPTKRCVIEFNYTSLIPTVVCWLRYASLLSLEPHSLVSSWLARVGQVSGLDSLFSLNPPTGIIVYRMLQDLRAGPVKGKKHSVDAFWTLSKSAMSS